MNKEDNCKCSLDGLIKLQEVIDKLQQENKQLREEIKAYQDLYFDKVVIINKAIEYIENELEYDMPSLEVCDMKVLLEILGELNENTRNN